jgi:mono/diheme cytochrome c family protein
MNTSRKRRLAGWLARGAYLARAGNCIGCHTSPGGALLAGGRAVDTPFGVVYAPNLTPDRQTGIGDWSSSEFWRALHHGRAQDGRLLYPAFPYPSFTRVTREDSDAMYAYLRSVAPVAQANRPHALGFPYSTQAALAVWRALYFRAATDVPEPAQSAEWNRGRYLVQGLGHCAACHSGRSFLGGTGLNAEFAGGLMPGGGWYAPSLASPKEAGVQGWAPDEVVRLLKTGVSAHASVSGPMAEVVSTSTQHLTEPDLRAMARFLSSIPAREHAPAEIEQADARLFQRGAQIYGDRCASCHGDQGEGVSAIYPALAGNRAVTLSSPHNLVQMVRHGGFAPSTAGNPQPFGMPPFEQALGNDEVAAVATYVRQSWGNAAAPVSALEVLRVR